ncbi:hypothetical protein DXT94_26460 [Rhizobium sp. ICMP 5592]|nr:hypothetical protein [Rhizobium sp. ICMP 5592]
MQKLPLFPRATIFLFRICVYPRGTASNRDGVGTRRKKILKIGISLMIASIVVAAPAMLLKSHD